MYSRNGMPNVLVSLGSLVLQRNGAQLKGTAGILYITYFTVRRYNLTAIEQLFRRCVSGFKIFYQSYPKYCMRYGIVLKQTLSILPSQR